VSESVQQRIPVVGGLGYAERVRRLPSTFTATLLPEPENRYFPTAVAVHVNGEKVGYLAPEVSRGLFEALKSRSEPVNCPGRRSCVSDHETSGVELLLDLSDLRL
jgi:hypothetical protein